MKDINLDELDNESLVELLTVLEGMDEVLKEEEEDDKND